FALWSGAPSSVIGRSAMSILWAGFCGKERMARRKDRRRRDSLGKTGRRLTSDPIRTSLGLLPSGSDPVGEWLVHRQSPGPYLGPKGPESKRAIGCHTPRKRGIQYTPIHRYCAVSEYWIIRFRG